MGDLVTFQEDQVIFQKGDPGGDLMVIQQGLVEIYHENSGVTTSLATMGKGEIIGLFTCLNNNPRTASARALNMVVVKIIPQEKIQKVLKGIPDWLNIIMKEYQLRIEHISQRLIDQKLELLTHKKNAKTYIDDARIFCGVLQTLAKLNSIVVDEVKYVVIEESLDLIADSMDTSITKVKAIFNCIFQAGLLLISIEADKKRQVIPVKIIEKLSDFTAFLRSVSKLQKTRKLAEYNFPDRAFRVGRALVSYSKHYKLKTGIMQKISEKDLETNLQKVTGTTYFRDGIEHLAQFQLVEFISVNTNKVDDHSKDDGSSLVAFTPSRLGRTIAHVIAYQKLLRLELEEKVKEVAA